MIRVLRVIALVFCLLILVGCAATASTGDWGEEMVYVRIDNGTNTMNYAVMSDGELVGIRAEGTKEHDFSSYKTGDVLKVEISQIQETFPGRVLFTRCEATGKTAEIKMNASSQSWLEDDTSGWTIVE